MEYPIMVHKIEEKDDEYYFVYHPDFGHCACSATGATIYQAILNLDCVRQEVIKYYEESGKDVPAPSKAPFDV